MEKYRWQYYWYRKFEVWTVGSRSSVWMDDVFIRAGAKIPETPNVYETIAKIFGGTELRETRKYKTGDQLHVKDNVIFENNLMHFGKED